MEQSIIDQLLAVETASIPRGESYSHKPEHTVEDFNQDDGDYHQYIRPISVPSPGVIRSYDNDLNMITCRLMTPVPRIYTPPKEILSRIQDQGRCGVCWAFTLCKVMSDVILRHTGQTIYFDQTDAILRSNTPDCDGAYLPDVFKMLKYVSVGEWSPDPFQLVNVLPQETKKVEFYVAAFSTVDDLKQYLVHIGPVAAILDHFKDIEPYDPNRVWYPSSGDGDLLHMIEIIGWYTDGWICRNSWGEKWPSRSFIKPSFMYEGCFRIPFSTFSESNLESVIAILPEEKILGLEAQPFQKNEPSTPDFCTII